MALCLMATVMFGVNTEKASASCRQLSHDAKDVIEEKMANATEGDYGLGIISDSEVIDLSSAGAISTLSLKDNKASVLVMG